MAFQAGGLISVVQGGGGGTDLEMEIRPCNVCRDLCSLQTLWRQLFPQFLVHNSKNLPNMENILETVV